MLLFINKLCSVRSPWNFTTYFLNFKEFVLNHDRKIVSVIIFKKFGVGQYRLGALRSCPACYIFVYYKVDLKFLVLYRYLRLYTLYGVRYTGILCTLILVHCSSRTLLILVHPYSDSCGHVMFYTYEGSYSAANSIGRKFLYNSRGLDVISKVRNNSYEIM